MLDYDGDSQQILIYAILTTKEFDTEIEESGIKTVERASIS